VKNVREEMPKSGHLSRPFTRGDKAKKGGSPGLQPWPYLTKGDRKKKTKRVLRGKEAQSKNLAWLRGLHQVSRAQTFHKKLTVRMDVRIGRVAIRTSGVTAKKISNCIPPSIERRRVGQTMEGKGKNKKGPIWRWACKEKKIYQKRTERRRARGDYELGLKRGKTERKLGG